jgi:hypothetical protein
VTAATATAINSRRRRLSSTDLTRSSAISANA